jgi:KTSC domain-containing protein
MKTISVVSNTLRTVGYDTGRQLLQIEFQNRSIYQYFEVPQLVHEELIQASSKGAYFNRSIRSHFDYVLVKAASLS